VLREQAATNAHSRLRLDRLAALHDQTVHKERKASAHPDRCQDRQGANRRETGSREPPQRKLVTAFWKQADPLA